MSYRHIVTSADTDNVLLTAEHDNSFGLDKLKDLAETLRGRREFDESQLSLTIWKRIFIISVHFVIDVIGNLYVNI